MLTPLKHRRWNRIKCTGLCAQVVNITRDHFLIYQPEFTEKLTGQTGLGFSTTGCYMAVIWSSRNLSRSLQNLTILLVKKSTNDSDKLSVPDGQRWAGLEFRSFSTDQLTRSSQGTCPQFQQVSRFVGCSLAATVAEARMRLFPNYSTSLSTKTEQPLKRAHSNKHSLTNQKATPFLHLHLP